MIISKRVSITLRFVCTITLKNAYLFSITAKYEKIKNDIKKSENFEKNGRERS